MYVQDKFWPPVSFMSQNAMHNREQAVAFGFATDAAISFFPDFSH